MIKEKKSVRVAVAQFRAIRGNIDRNSSEHLKLIKSASEKDVDIIVFPELSLTGYEPDMSNSLKVSSATVQNMNFNKVSEKFDITIVVGAPVDDGHGLPKLGAIIFSPGKEPILASKINLHSHELDYFSPGKSKHTFTIKGVVFGLAICADALNESHISSLRESGVDCCLAPSLITENGYDNDVEILRNYADKYRFSIAVSNYIGKSGVFFSTGKSMIINQKHQIQSQASINEVGFIWSDI
ncbi:carbon-nitrogen hydrolase family protein [Vibrio tasmaniensis]|uniref:carbon-nitrogen hydrolase family protein n=1 Tax=Vibrio tasmaniensis TaxID=212663 RepID=UPI001119B80C|nr:carbon-nitrogen hydrolase family protein [Vibrio tasmaniensis]